MVIKARKNLENLLIFLKQKKLVLAQKHILGHQFLRRVASLVF